MKMLEILVYIYVNYLFRQTNTVNYTYQAPKEYSTYNADHQQNGQSMPAPSQAQSSMATRELDDLMDSLSGFKVR